MSTSKIQNKISSAFGKGNPFVSNAVWVAVIEQSLMDALGVGQNKCSLHERIKSIAWIYNESDDFKMVCDYAILEYSWVRKLAMHLIERSGDSQQILNFISNNNFTRDEIESSDIVDKYTKSLAL